MSRISKSTILFCALAGTMHADTTHITVQTGDGKREVNLPPLLGGNIAVWYQPEQMASGELAAHFDQWQPGLLRLPGGSWSDELVWNGNGIRSGNRVDSSKFSGGQWNIDYSGYAPGFRLQKDPSKPGGIVASDYHGNLDVRTLHEFARKHQAKAIVTVNAGTGTPEMAAEWLKWTRKEGYKVAYWEIGNELDGEWELGHIMPDGKRMTADDYARRFKEFAKALKAVDPNVKVGGPACSNDKLLFVETLIREAGDTLDFVSFHTYPVLANNATEARRFEQARDVKKAVATIRSWIRQYHPDRVGKIAIGVTEWHKQVAETRATVDLSSGLWSCLFIGSMAESGVDFANLWDCFSQTDTGGHGLFERKTYTPRAAFHALNLWRHHMGSTWLETSGSDSTLQAYATGLRDGVAVMLVNTSPDENRNVSIRINGHTAGGTVEATRLSPREYFWNPHANTTAWSMPPASISMTADKHGAFTIPAYSAVVLDFASKPVLRPTEDFGDAELSFMLPEKIPADLPIEGFVAVREKGKTTPWKGTVESVTLKVDGPATLDRNRCATSSAVGEFRIRPTGPGTCVITATAGNLKSSATVRVMPVEERKQVVWQFSDAASLAGMESNYRLGIDEQVRPNQAVASVTLENAVSVPHKNALLGITKIPESLDKQRIGGITTLIGVSPDFRFDDKGATLQIVLQSNSDHWITLGTIKLADLSTGVREITLRKSDPAFFEAMRELYAIRFILNTTKPVNGSIHLDDIGFILRSN